ncbi:MAG: hypothetical protein DHS20C18_37020 [Saprospiraceae bacterium]|nr:MAG: hypothetical protein DHS20C18_37020 [Saprospiraceae bacterium]
MNLNKLISLLFLVGLIGPSCQEEIDLNPVAPEPVLVVDGRITNEFQRHVIRLSLSGSFASDTEYVPATGAMVSISGKTNVYMLEETSPGYYLTDSLKGKPGTVYHLRIEWQGKIYEAKDGMSETPEAFEPAYFGTDQGFLDFEFRRHQFGFSIPNQWELLIIPETLHPDIDISKRGLQIGVEVLPGGIYSFQYFTHPTIEVNGLLNFEATHFYGFQPGFTVVQKRYSLSDKYYDFLRALFMETEWRGTLFDTTPGNVKGNISNGALGFFSANAVRVIRFKPE